MFILKVYNQNHYYQQEFETVKQMAERFHASTESLDHKNKELQQKISQIKEEVEKEIGASLINLQIKLANIRKDFECVVRNEVRMLNLAVLCNFNHFFTATIFR